MLVFKNRLLCNKCYLKERGDGIYYPQKLDILKLFNDSEVKGRKVQKGGSIYISRQLSGKIIKFKILDII